MIDPKGGPGWNRNLLVVSTAEELGGSLARYLSDGDVVKIVVPVVGQGLLDWLANDERAFSHAEDVAGRLAEELPGNAVAAGAGEADVGLAVRDALATFPADEILVAVVTNGDEDVTESINATNTRRGRTIEGVPVRVVAVTVSGPDGVARS